MSKASTPPALPRKPSNYPAFGYREAMALHFPSEQGERISVGACSEAQFTAWIEQVLTAYQQSEHASLERLNALQSELGGLEYEEPLARWYAVLTLQEHHIPFPLSSSEEMRTSESEVVV